MYWPVAPGWAAGAPLLAGLEVEVADDCSARWAGALLASLGARVTGRDGEALLTAAGVTVAGARRTPAQVWAGSGAMSLTGRAGGPPLPAYGQPGVAARGAGLALELLSALGGSRVRVDGARLLAERAALAGLRRRGATSAGGGTRLLRTRDGWVALSLARPDDRELVPALVGEPADDPWEAAAGWAADQLAQDVAERAQLLGLACGALPGDGPDEQQRARGAAAAWLWQDAARGSRPAGRAWVLDLSGLWAGPLCGHLLGLAGAEVVKVESRSRPDGARTGTPAFFDLLHAGQAAVAPDLATPRGRAQLLRLVRTADVVIEASRPRALAQLGLVAGELVRERPGLTWVSITAYGRTGPWSNRSGFGDDVAVAAGLVAVDADGPVFAGDALADPLTGLHAAVAALAGVRGGGGLVDVAMRDVARLAATAPDAAAEPLEPAAPVARPARGCAPRLGADDERLLPR